MRFLKNECTEGYIEMRPRSEMQKTMGVLPGKRAGLSYYVFCWMSAVGESGCRILKNTAQPPNNSESQIQILALLATSCGSLGNS